jgi:hypothetical protein
MADVTVKATANFYSDSTGARSAGEVFSVSSEQATDLENAGYVQPAQEGETTASVQAQNYYNQVQAENDQSMQQLQQSLNNTANTAETTQQNVTAPADYTAELGAEFGGMADTATTPQAEATTTTPTVGKSAKANKATGSL